MHAWLYGNTRSAFCSIVGFINQRNYRCWNRKLFWNVVLGYISVAAIEMDIELGDI